MLTKIQINKYGLSNFSENANLGIFNKRVYRPYSSAQMKWRFFRRNITLWILLSALLAVVLIVWNTNEFFVKFKQEERLKMEIWATAQTELLRSTVDQELGNLPLQVFAKNTTTPMIHKKKNGTLEAHNLPEKISADSLLLVEKMKAYAKQNEPILMVDGYGDYGILFYGNSEVLNKLRWYPLFLFLIIVFFSSAIYFYFKTNKASEQNRLWAGMAKETAHQIGTPLTSLIGWAELLKQEQISDDIPREINKDIERLQVITDRFSKIGSVPRLEPCDLIRETRENWNYLALRNRLVNFHWQVELEELVLPLNPALYGWSIENLVKNGIDAMKGKGDIYLQIHRHRSMAHISIRDTGSGIPRKLLGKLFQPGVTSKERGWGLGLSLVKRIVEEYHGGRIRILHTSEKGTSMQIALPIETAPQRKRGR